MSIGTRPRRWKKMQSFKLNKNKISLTKENRLHHFEVPIIALTGGIATGKSSVSKILKEKNIPLIDADKLVKNIYQKTETFNFIQSHFPACIENNQIDFKRLRTIAFSNNEHLQTIEKFIYQYMPQEFLRAYHELGGPDFIFYDVPLLFEKNLDKFVDQKICVYAPYDMQLMRLIERDQLTKELAQKILSKQLDIEIKKSKSDFIIINTNSIEDLKNNTENILRSLS
jgi:dephospho-CoA kinase